MKKQVDASSYTTSRDTTVQAVLGVGAQQRFMVETNRADRTRYADRIVSHGT